MNAVQNSEKKRVLIADDSGFMRLLIRDILNSNDKITVVGTATDGKEAYEKVKSLKPDVVLLDMIMPKYDGLYAVEKIMSNCPTPIVVLSSLGNSNINPIMKSLELGALDYVNKPAKGNAKLRDIQYEIHSKVLTASSVNMDVLVKSDSKRNFNPHVFLTPLPYHVIVIGSSTGGPSALERVVEKLPTNLPLPVLIAQHMPENFVASFAKRIDSLVPLDVHIGEEGRPVLPGQIIIAPGNKNMIVKSSDNGFFPTISFSSEVYPEYNNPSVSALMISAAEVFKKKTIGVILTGMGKDGADGMVAIKNQGGMTIAQSQESCTVFGMPREAILRNGADHIVNLRDIGGYIISCLS